MSQSILAFAGSLRAGSFNRALLRAAQELAPAGMSIESFDLRPIPFYDGDLEAQGVPESVTRLKQAIRAADGLLIVTPEYNAGVPAVLKNAIDWASRTAPGDASVLAGKPVGLMGATPGTAGTLRAQAMLRQSLTNTRTYPLQGPEVAVSQAHTKFDAEGRLTDEKTREHVAAYLVRLAAWMERLRGMS